MMRKKSIISGLLILLSITILTSCVGAAMPPEETRADMRPEEALQYFSQQIEKGSLRDISLTIYYFSPYILTFDAVSVEGIIRGHDYKIVVDGTRLEVYIDLLKQMINTALIPAEHEQYLNARIYYVFETKEGEKLFDVAMWGYLSSTDSSIYVNGLEVKEDNIFYDVLMPFLPEDAAKELNKYLSDGKLIKITRAGEQ